MRRRTLVVLCRLARSCAAFIHQARNNLSGALPHRLAVLVISLVVGACYGNRDPQNWPGGIDPDLTERDFPWFGIYEYGPIRFSYCWDPFEPPPPPEGVQVGTFTVAKDATSYPFPVELNIEHDDELEVLPARHTLVPGEYVEFKVYALYYFTGTRSFTVTATDILGSIAFPVTDVATETIPVEGAPCPQPAPAAGIPLRKVEALGESAFPQVTLASTSLPGAFGIVGPFFIAGGSRDMEIPLFPPPPPGTPLPTQETTVVVLFDALGEEQKVLALGDAPGSSVSAAVLSHVDAGGSGQLQQAASRTDVLVSYGSISLTTTGWNPDIDDFGMSQVSPQVTNVTDVSPYNDDPESGGAVIAWFGGQMLLFLEYDPSIQFFTTAPGAEVTSSQFAGASGGPVSAFRWQAGGQTLFVTDGQPGELWSHPGGTANATKVGSLGNGPRQIRFLGEIGVVSNFDSGTLTIVRRQSNGTVTILGTVSVGDGPIAIDMRLSTPGNIEVLSTGFNDHTYTLTVLSPTGSVIGTPTARTVPEGGLNPVHAIFVNEAGTRISVSCNGSDEVLIFDLPS